MCGWKVSVDDVLQRHGTPSQTEPASTPEAIQDQQSSGGPSEKYQCTEALISVSAYPDCMAMRPWLIGMLLAGALELGACSSGPRSSSSSTTSTSPTTPSGLAVHVSPNVNLHNSEVVHVSVSGFPPGKAFLSECASVADVSAEGCGAQLAAQPFVVIENGAGTATFTIANQAVSAPLTTEPSVLCTDQCVLVATSGVPASGTKHIQTASLAFAS